MPHHQQNDIMLRVDWSMVRLVHHLKYLVYFKKNLYLSIFNSYATSKTQKNNNQYVEVDQFWSVHRKK